VHTYFTKVAIAEDEASCIWGRCGQRRHRLPRRRASCWLEINDTPANMNEHGVQYEGVKYVHFPAIEQLVLALPAQQGGCTVRDETGIAVAGAEAEHRGVRYPWRKCVRRLRDSWRHSCLACWTRTVGTGVVIDIQSSSVLQARGTSRRRGSRRAGGWGRRGRRCLSLRGKRVTLGFVVTIVTYHAPCTERRTVACIRASSFSDD
jgi:hypothetical protein